MKKALFTCVVLSLVLVATAVLSEQATAPTQTSAAPASDLTVSRMEIAGSVENREPVGIAESFPARQEKVSCFVELRDIPVDTTITFVWSLDNKEIDKVSQQIKKSWRWRTWSNKTINGMKGDWKVDLVDEAGAVLKSASFKVE